MTEDEHLAIPGERRPLVQWLPTGRSEERMLAFGAFSIGLLIGALVVGGAVYGRARFLER